MVAFWFRRDLRLEDNVGLYHALETGKPVLPVFIFDRNILDDLEDKDDARLTFIHRELSGIHGWLRRQGTGLVTIHDRPKEAWKKLLDQFPIEAVYTNHDYEPYAKERDQEIKELLLANGVSFHTFRDQVIFEREEILTNEDKPYHVFTPYANKWRNTLSPDRLKSVADAKDYRNWVQIEDSEFPTLKELGFTESTIEIPGKQLTDETLQQYGEKRDIPAVNGTSRMSHHLRFGTVSIRNLAQRAKGLSNTYLNELIWREFYMMILDHYPRVITTSFQQKYDDLDWNRSKEDFERWCKGKTGIPIVDAGMRQLNETAYMHNRVRMIVASFLTKNLFIDWRWGESYFARKLLDYELSSNNGGWQWAASTGTDAAPYFRVFNPVSQQRKFDPNFTYIKQWIPEINTDRYPEPIVDLKDSRRSAIERYKAVG